MNRLVLLVGAFSSQDPAAVAQTRTGEEVILAAEVKTQGIEFRVASGGCTRKADFGLQTIKANPLTVKLVRLRPDHCEAFLPNGVTLTFSFAEIGAQPHPREEERRLVTIVNPRRPSP